MLTMLILLSLFALVQSNDLYNPVGVVGIDKEGDTFIYNGLVQKHWVKTQMDNIKLSQARINPSDGALYGIEKGSGKIFRKNSFSEKFVYVSCCVTTFTFIENPTASRLPEIIKVLVIDGKKMMLQQTLTSKKFEFDLDMDVVSVASVGDTIALVTAEGDLYTLSMEKSRPQFRKIQLGSAFNFKKISSISPWTAEGRFMATSSSLEAWHSNTDLKVWEKFGNGRSCCVESVFEVSNTESFGEHRFPFCSQTNIENVPTVITGDCRVINRPFGKQVFTGNPILELPCISYIDSTVLEETAQDLASDYKISIKMSYSDMSSMIGIAFNLIDDYHYDYIFMAPDNLNCFGMGHMTRQGPVEKNLQIGCPGSRLYSDQIYVLEILTVEAQVQVRINGGFIFTEYPFYENLAAGGVLVWPSGHPVTLHGMGICYVPQEDAEKHIYEPREGSFEPTSDPYAEGTEYVTRSTTATPTYTPPYDGNDNNINEIESSGHDADGYTELLSHGIKYKYFLFTEPTGWSSANMACRKLKYELLLIDDAIQNERVTDLLKEHGVFNVWLGKFWIDKWEILISDGSRIGWDNFAERPVTSPNPKFATLGMSSYWEIVEPNGRYPYVCQQAIDITKEKDLDNTNRPLVKDPDDDPGDIPPSFEHPPVVSQGPVNVTAKIGDTVTFKCTASSKPPPTVIIVKIDDESVPLPETGDSSKLNDESQRVTTIVELDDVTRDDAGKYACIAQNQFGEASASAWLIIEDSDELREFRPTCYFWGDPHVQTFDGNRYDFPGVCTYLLSIDCIGSTFWIYGRMKECGGGGDTGPSLSALESLTIFARPEEGNHTGIELQRGWVINIGGAKLRISEGMTARHGNLKIKRTSEHVIVTLPNKVTVQWDGLQMVVIELPYNFEKDRTCGLCGRYNGDPTDGFYMQNGPTDYTNNPIEFGNSWAYVDIYRYNSKCEDVDLEPVDPCEVNEDREPEASMHCYDHLYQVPFSSCHSKVDPREFYINCKRDWCGSEWRRDQNLPLCNALSAYATACEKAGRPISSWRSAELCPIEEIKQITKEEGCPWDELEFDFDPNEGERDVIDP